MKMTRRLYLLLIVMAAVSLTIACGDDDDDSPTVSPVATSTAVPAASVPTATAVATEDDHEHDEIKIGLLSPQTGPIAVYASGFEDAADVAIAELNESQHDFVFELVVADSGCDGTQAATAAQSLIDTGVVAIVGAACSGGTLGAIAVAAPAGVPLVSYASTSPAITNADDDGHLFRVVPSDAQQAVALSQVIAQASVSDPAILFMTNDYGSGLADNFESSWSADVCTQVGYDPTEGSYDASTLAQSVVDGDCDSVVLMSYATDGAAIMEALLAQGFTGNVFGADGLADAAFQDSFTDISALDRLVATKPRPGGASTAKADFDTAYAAAGGDTEGIYTHETYDAVKMIAAAFLADPEGDLKAALASVGTNYDGASGSHTFDSSGDVLGTGYSICKFVVTGDTTGFSCPQIWTADSGISSSEFGGELVKIGLLSPQTGPIAVYAAGFESAADIAIDTLNAMDPENYRFELLVADSGCDGTIAASAAQTFIDSGVAAIAGAACSGATLGAIAVAAEAGVPMVSYASTSPAITSADDDDHLFRVVPADDLQARALADVVGAEGLDNPAVLFMTNDYGAGLADFFDAAWSSGDICSSVGYDPTEGSYDAATLAQSVVDAGCDSVVLMSYATDGASIVEELKGQGFGGAVFGADGIADAGFIDASNDSSTLDGIIATKPRPSSDSARKVLFDSAWTRTGGPEGAIYTHETFDAVLLIGLAVLSGDSDVADAVATTGTGFEGASGTHTFDSAGDVIGNGYEVCSFSYAGSAASFGCSQIWTTDSGLTNK